MTLVCHLAISAFTVLPVSSTKPPGSLKYHNGSVRTKGRVEGFSSETFLEQLRADSRFLKSDRRLDTDVADRLILQLNRIYPQVLTDNEAKKFRDLDVPTCIRLAELLTHLQEKGEEACREFYRALHLHVEEVYFSLPTRLRRRDSIDLIVSPLPIPRQRFVLNDRGPLFFLSCFSVAVGVALLYYCGESKAADGTSRALGLAALGLGCRVREVLIWYTEDAIPK